MVKIIEEDIYESINKQIATVQMHAQETEKAFIFSVIGPFVESHSVMEISKEELLRAIALVRMQREALAKYGVQINNDWSSATHQSLALSEAYMRGVKDGIAKEQQRIAAMRENFESKLKGEKDE